MEHLWGSLCECWPKNVRIIIRYLFIVSGMAPNELVEYVSTGLNFSTYYPTSIVIWCYEFFRPSVLYCILDVHNRLRRWTLWCSNSREESNQFGDIIKYQMLWLTPHTSFISSSIQKLACISFWFLVQSPPCYDADGRNPELHHRTDGDAALL